MLTCSESDGIIRIETDVLQAAVRTRNYVTGIMGGSFVDKATGARDPGWGLHIWDFLMAPGWRDDWYTKDRKIHGDLPKHLVESPQVSTQIPELEYSVVQGPKHVAVKVWFTFTKAGEGYRAGSCFEQTVLFTPDAPYVFSWETVRSVNDLPNMFYRFDMPGHVRHNRGDTFKQVYLSYFGLIKNEEFLEDFPPDARFFYVRRDSAIPDRFIRACELPGTEPGRTRWLAGMTLDPAAPCEAWCHQRGYICFIQENHGRPVRCGQTVGAAYLIGYFDSVEDMQKAYDKFKGVRFVRVDENRYDLETEIPQTNP